MCKQRSTAAGPVRSGKRHRCLRALCKAARLALILLAVGCLGAPTNVWAATNARLTQATVKIPVACQAPGISEAFRYCLWDSDGNLIEPRLLLHHGQEDWFTLTVTSPGRYAYTVTQEPGTDADVTYDDTRFQAVVYVEEAENALNAQLILYCQDGGDKLSKLTFVNQKKENGENGSGGGSSGDDSTNSGTGGGNNNGDDNSGSNNGGSGNGSTNGSGSGNDNGSGSFWGNGSFWGSSSGSTSGSGFWGNAFVRTGDSAPLALWVITALAAIALAAGLLLYKRNNEMRTDRKDREDG